MQTSFRQLLLRASEWLGSPWAVTMAALAIIGWGLLGHRVQYSDRWQLAIDTMTSIVTFLMVFLIQYSQNRDVKAIQLKLDELIRAVDGARTHLVQLEGLSDEDLSRLQDEFQQLRGVARWAHSRRLDE